MTTLFWTGVGFLFGAMPFSLWVGRLFMVTDIRRYGDGNPGATNAWRAGGWRLGLPALVLDYLKGAIPVSLAHFVFGISGWGLVVAALAPTLVHAFSPFLGFRGGKALAATFGIWTGLTLGEGPIIIGLLMGLFLLVQSSDGWAVVLAMFVFLGHLLLRQTDIYVLTIWAGSTLLLTWKYRSTLDLRPEPRPAIIHLARRTIDKFSHSG